ncbi:5-methylcytosine rRNA methyltransferase l(2)10685 isoform X2 [Rhodnius prolixus]|uniref:5-methylcytosine rRNA methyltransferase l(2)10685 isoform X2 n=1 Tax=Rhodnius prolixus TaxID=13249 RepID=UPI003D18F6AA
MEEPFDKALEYFDDFYGNVFNKMWPSVRLALLSSQKYVAVVNNFSDTDRIIPHLENLGGVNIRDHFEVERRKLNETKQNKGKEKNIRLDVRKRVQKFSEGKKEEELTSLYPSNEKSYVAASSLGAEKGISEDRLIEPSLGMSASALSEYIPASALKGMEDWMLESQHFSYYAGSLDYPIRVIEQDMLEFPVHLNAYTFELGNVERFPSPKKGSTGVSDYYLLNGGSLLPVLALDLKPGDDVLDLCAAPGGKGLLCIQTLYPRSVVLNDVSGSRINKINRVMHEFLYNFEERNRKEEIVITQLDGRMFNLENTFNKIIVDVPCTSDRHSVTEDDNNIFKNDRLKERIKIPELQSELLINALKLVKVGGIVVYATCSLSPTQNDGVIALALRKLSEQTNNEYVVIDMKKALGCSGELYRFGSEEIQKCGHLVLPYLPANFGPTFFCKIVRIK